MSFGIGIVDGFSVVSSPANAFKSAPAQKVGPFAFNTTHQTALV
jgi:hypothetical protein